MRLLFGATRSTNDIDYCTTKQTGKPTEKVPLEV